MSQPTTLPAQIVADTIIRTVELGVRITDAAVAGETTVVFARVILRRLMLDKTTVCAVAQAGRAAAHTG